MRSVVLIAISFLLATNSYGYSNNWEDDKNKHGFADILHIIQIENVIKGFLSKPIDIDKTMFANPPCDRSCFRTIAKNKSLVLYAAPSNLKRTDTVYVGIIGSTDDSDTQGSVLPVGYYKFVEFRSVPQSNGYDLKFPVLQKID